MDTPVMQGMKTFHTIAGLREVLDEARQQGKALGFVPTMGNLHEGHLQLVHQAGELSDVVIASIFVNPLQFGLNEDWEKYPRTFEDDVRKLEDAGCHYLFYPDENEIYPNGMADQTRVVVPTMTDILCGASRPGHFEGVTTVVSKLLNIVQPDTAIFGIKDFQQLAVIRRMVEDLCIPVDIVGAPIARDYDGLALSSRNSYLTEAERPRVKLLYQTLCWCRDEIAGGARDFAGLESAATDKLERGGFRVDYVSIRNAKSLEPAAHDDTEVVILGAIYTSGARLIDNVSLNVELSAEVGSNRIMLTNMLKAKLHMASVTQAELWYDGSCAIDSNLLKLAGMREFEQIDIYNVNNGERFTTYIIKAEAGSGIISMNGAAARKVQVGDRIIIATYGQLDEAEADVHKPKLVYLDADNSVERTANTIPVQAVS